MNKILKYVHIAIISKPGEVKQIFNLGKMSLLFYILNDDIHKILTFSKTCRHELTQAPNLTT